MTNSVSNSNANAVATALGVLNQVKTFMLAARNTGVTRTLNRTKLTVVQSDKQHAHSRSKSSVGLSGVPIDGTAYVLDNSAVLSLIDKCEVGFKEANDACNEQMTINNAMHESIIQARQSMQELCKASFLDRLKFALFGPSKSLRNALHNL